MRTNRTVMRFYDLAAELTRGVAELAAALEPREPLLAAELRGRGPRGVAELASQAAHYPTCHPTCHPTCYLPGPHSASASSLATCLATYCLLTAYSRLLVCRPRSASTYRRRSSGWPTRCTPRPRRSTRASEPAPRQGGFLARAAVAAPAPAAVLAQPRARQLRAGGPRSRSAIARRTGHFKPHFYEY